MDNIDFTEYDRITDILMYLSDDMSLNFTVSLSRKSKNGERLFYHYESIYGSDKFGTPQRSIKRQMNFYFVINVFSNFNSGILIRPQDAEMLVMLIENKVLPWYFGTPQQSAFQIINEELCLKEFEPVTYFQSEQKYITFEPIVDKYNEYEKDTRGVKITLGSGETAILDINKFMGFLHLLKSDMYAVACNLTTYAKTGPYGVNSMSTQGLGATPSNKIKDKDAWNGFGKNKFLDGK